MVNNISFPELGISLEINRVAFSLFDKDIYWYGIIIGLGFILAIYYTSYRAKDFNLKEDDILDMLIIATPVAIICARIYYVAFEWKYYKDDLMSIFAIWEGGIAIYGAVIGSIIVVILYCRAKKIKLGNMLDVGSLGLLIGQFIGRWGNFVNAEAFGGETDGIFGMSINGSLPVHPTFLYESVWNFIGFIMLHFYSKKRKFAGEVFFMYIGWYGFGRTIIEGMRTDSLYVGNTELRISQLVGIISVIAAIAAISFFRNRAKLGTISSNFSLENENSFVPPPIDAMAERYRSANPHFGKKHDNEDENNNIN